MRNKRLMAAGASLLIGAASLAQAQEAGDASRGREYAERTCAICHAVGPEDVQVTRGSVVSFRTIANTKGMTGRALAAWLQTPHPTMPNLIVEPHDRDDVIAYILSLRDQQ